MAPAETAEKTMLSSSNIVSTSTAVPGHAAAISRVASMPCSSGSCRSMMTTFRL